MASRRGLAVAAAAGLAATLAAPGMATPASAAGSANSQGSFSAPFQEQGLPDGSTPCTAQDSQAGRCIPTAVSAAVLANGRILYWDGLEGSERANLSTLLQFGAVAAPDQSRVLDLANLTWTKPSPIDGGGGSNPQPDLLVPGSPYVQGASNALFCSALNQLPDGRIMSSGGTDYYDEPGVPGTTLGVSELEGLKLTRIFNPATNTWTLSGAMNFGRWYPETVTLPDGQIFVASGVTKLIKPVYSNDLADSGTNVKQTETYNPKTGTWTYNGASADHSLPLFPRLHLLPDGKVYYDAGGQTFNPDGQSYDEATWNIASVYDPQSKSWTNLDIPGVGTTYPGFKGSTFSLMLPLAPPYTSASFLAAGGVYGVTPGTYVANNASTITTIDTGNADKLSTVQTGNLQNRRWYSTGVVLPDESVMAFSGAEQDGVVGPGDEIPVHQAERFDPTTNTWTAMASGGRDRTYHNTAELLPSGAVLVGGHSPIPNNYGIQMTTPGGVTANNEKDPSFEIYYPPYYSQKRPVIEEAPESLGYGQTAQIETPNAASIAKVLLVRNTAITHLVDGDQRTVELPIVHRGDDSVTVELPSNRAVLPPGPYMLFVDTRSSSGLVPSTAVQTFVGTPFPEWAKESPAVGTAPSAPPHDAVGSSQINTAAPSTAGDGTVPRPSAAASRIARVGATTLAASQRGAFADRRVAAMTVAAVLLALGGVRALLRVRRRRWPGAKPL